MKGCQIPFSIDNRLHQNNSRQNATGTKQSVFAIVSGTGGRMFKDR